MQGQTVSLLSESRRGSCSGTTDMRAQIRPLIALLLQVVSDQIGLWQWELRRLGAHRSVLYSNFESRELYRRFVGFTTKLGIQVFRSDEKQQVVVQAEGHEECKAEIKRLKSELNL